MSVPNHLTNSAAQHSAFPTKFLFFTHPSLLINRVTRTEGGSRLCKSVTEGKSILAGSRRQRLLTVPTFAFFFYRP